MLCINGASAALCVSDIPFGGPVGAVRVGRVSGEFVVNPTHAQREYSDLDLVYVGTYDEIIMIEGEAKELPEDKFIEALHFAHPHVQKIIEAQRDLASRRRQGKARDAALRRARRDSGDRLPGRRRPHRGRHLQPRPRPPAARPSAR